ncbi:MAG: hypothetical protein L6R39_000903 [Caloplaca ligustica]|nr:MAG: hypothetical protein L6R39_000903 [Caloplaca ligustica]
MAPGEGRIEGNGHTTVFAMEKSDDRRTSGVFSGHLPPQHHPPYVFNLHADEHSIPSAEHEAQAEVPSREDPETDAQTQHISRSRARKDVKKAAKARKAANWEANQQKVAKGRKMKAKEETKGPEAGSSASDVDKS